MNRHLLMLRVTVKDGERALLTRDGRRLSEERGTNERQVGVCRHFTLLHVAMLRAQGIPARARCGFGVYFEKGKYLDHWVTEYWNEKKALGIVRCTNRRSPTCS